MDSFGIGVDIENIERFARLDKAADIRFLNKIFSEKEQGYCFGFKSPAEHLAARYAGKEAVVKAMTSLGRKEIVYRDIEILNDDTGIPRVNISRADCQDIKVKISLSHCEDKAIAFAIVTEQ